MNSVSHDKCGNREGWGRQEEVGDRYVNLYKFLHYKLHIYKKETVFDKIFIFPAENLVCNMQIGETIKINNFPKFDTYYNKKLALLSGTRVSFVVKKTFNPKR